MIIHLIWSPRRAGDRPRDSMVVVREAHPIPGWLCYTRVNGVRHLIPSTALMEVYFEAEPGDPDPMKERSWETAPERTFCAPTAE
jgi:hypothetical protein